MIFKFYNPFKLHIIETCEEFYIRKLTLFGWMYLDRTELFFWYDTDLHFANCATLEQAKFVISRYPKLVKEHKQKHKIIRHDT